MLLQWVRDPFRLAGGPAVPFVTRIEDHSLSYKQTGELVPSEDGCHFPKHDAISA